MWSVEVNKMICKLFELFEYVNIKEAHNRRKREKLVEERAELDKILKDMKTLYDLIQGKKEDIESQYNVFIYDTILYPPGSKSPEKHDN